MTETSRNFPADTNETPADTGPTNRPRTRSTAPKRRLHPASDARFLSLGVAASLTLGGIGVMGLLDRPQPAATASPSPVENADPLVAPDTTLSTVAATVPTIDALAPTVVVIRRVHHVPPATDVTNAAWTPAPVNAGTDSRVQTVSTASQRSVTAAKAAAKKRAPVRRAARTKAS